MNYVLDYDASGDPYYPVVCILEDGRRGYVQTVQDAIKAAEDA